MTRPEHAPGRPHWHCTTCGDHWPCEPARRAMIATAAAADVGIRGLRVSMLATQADAESDFVQLGTLAEHGDLHERFVAWVIPNDHRTAEQCGETAVSLTGEALEAAVTAASRTGMSMSAWLPKAVVEQGWREQASAAADELHNHARQAHGPLSSEDQQWLAEVLDEHGQSS